MSKMVLKAENLSKVYRQGREEIRILNGVSLAVRESELIAIVGASGSGKSTLLNILGTLDYPTSGRVEVCGQDVASLNDRARGRLRNESIGFVYQFHHLLPEFSALENVAMPCLIGGMAPRRAREKAVAWLERVGLGHRLSHRPAKLSGGERQRVAIARALVTEPDLVLMDEPTGNLDPDTAAHVQETLLELARNQSMAFVLVTHDMDLACRTGRVLKLTHGHLEPA